MPWPLKTILWQKSSFLLFLKIGIGNGFKALKNCYQLGKVKTFSLWIHASFVSFLLTHSRSKIKYIGLKRTFTSELEAKFNLSVRGWGNVYLCLLTFRVRGHNTAIKFFEVESNYFSILNIISFYWSWIFSIKTDDTRKIVHKLFIHQGLHKKILRFWLK